MVNKVYLENFESRITDELLRMCKQYSVLDGTLLATDDITARWDDLAPEYMADAVHRTAVTQRNYILHNTFSEGLGSYNRCQTVILQCPGKNLRSTGAVAVYKNRHRKLPYSSGLAVHCFLEVILI